MAYELASPSGLIVGFWFFLAMSAAIAFMIYALMTWPSARRRELAVGPVRKSIAVPVAAAIWLTIFSTIYRSSLAGFHTVRVDDNELRIEYAFPASSVTLRHADVGNVTRRPAYKLQWRLEILTNTGHTFESAPGSQRRVKEAAEEIEKRRPSTLPPAS